MRLLVLLLMGCVPAIRAEDARLEAIRALLAPMRNAKSGNLEARGATPALTDAKHRLREWVESRLAELRWNGTRWLPNPIVLQEQLNEELERAGLVCGAPQLPCPEWSGPGFLGRVVLDMQAGSFLVVRTASGSSNAALTNRHTRTKRRTTGGRDFGTASRMTTGTGNTFRRSCTQS